MSVSERVKVDAATATTTRRRMARVYGDLSSCVSAGLRERGVAVAGDVQIGWIG